MSTSKSHPKMPLVKTVSVSVHPDFTIRDLLLVWYLIKKRTVEKITDKFCKSFHLIVVNFFFVWCKRNNRLSCFNIRFKSRYHVHFWHLFIGTTPTYYLTCVISWYVSEICKIESWSSPYQSFKHYTCCPTIPVDHILNFSLGFF